MAVSRSLSVLSLIFILQAIFDELFIGRKPESALSLRRMQPLLKVFEWLGN